MIPKYASWMDNLPTKLLELKQQCFHEQHWETISYYIIISYLIGGLEHVLFSPIAWDDDPI